MRPRAPTSSNDVALDNSGTASASAKRHARQVGTEQLFSNVDITDVTHQMISAGTTAIVHTAEHYAGIELENRFVDAKTKLSPKFLALRPKGERVAGAPLKIELIKRVWTVAKQGSGATSVTTVSTPGISVVASCALVSAKQPVGCDLTPQEAGQYIVRASSEDARKNTVAASVRVYVSGESSSGLSAFSESDRSDVELVTDKKAYKVGDKARVLVKSPWKGADAIVTVERAGVFSQRRVKLFGAAPAIDIPITEEMRPNAFVSVMVLKGRGKAAPAGFDKPDVGAPAFRMGYENLLIDPESKRLDVTVIPQKTDMRPGEEAVVSIKVRDAQGKGKKTELTLIAADEGVLSLVGYQLPDPIATFGAPRPLHVATLESRETLAVRFDPLSGLGLDKGLDGGGGDGDGAPGSSARRDFRASAFFSPSIVTNDDGDAEVKFKLPDGLTTYRVMAMAVGSDDRFGRGESSVTTSRPLMARPALPRFLRAGDTFDASVIVSSKSASAEEVDVTAKLSGVVVDGDTKKHVRVEPGKSVEVRFKAKRPRVGQTAFAFSIDSGKEGRRPGRAQVAIPMTLESVALYGSTTTVSAESSETSRASRDDTGELVVTSSSTALVGLDGGSTQLLEYPYGCTEQLTSKLVPLVGLKDLAKDFNLKLPANSDDVVEKTVAKLLTHQRYDGAFGFWPDSPKSSAWATTYALWGLDQAKGYRVPESALENATRYLSRALDNEKDEFREAVGPFTLYVLAELGKPEPGRVSTLAESKNMPLYSKALLLSAAVLSKNDQSVIDKLATSLESSIRVEGEIARTAENLGWYATYLDSDVRTSASCCGRCSTRNRATRWRSSLQWVCSKTAMVVAGARPKESSLALLALGDYRKAQEKAEPNFVARTFFGSDLVGEHTFKGRSVVPEVETYPAARLLGQSGSAISFSVEGEGKLFYEARLRYARKKLPTDVVDRGFFVQRRYRKVTAATLEEALESVPSASISRTSTRAILCWPTSWSSPLSHAATSPSTTRCRPASRRSTPDLPRLRTACARSIAAVCASTNDDARWALRWSSLLHARGP
jgi:hypothetical protein